MFDALIPSLRGHAQWVRNWRASPKTYLEPVAPDSVFDHAADEIERLRGLLREALNSRAPDFVETVYPGWATLAREALGEGEQSPDGDK